jgi:hypothetical protein
MGILNEKDIYSPKWVTAMITDSKNELHFVPIKHEIGDYFIAEIDNKNFVFSLKNARILNYRKTLARSFRVIQYDTCHYTSVSDKNKEIEKILLKNGLPKIDRTLHNALRIFGRREKQMQKSDEFKPQKIQDIIALIVEEGGEQYKQQIKELQEYLTELDIDEICTPVQKVTDYLTDNFIATTPSFLGEAVPYFQRMDEEHKKISNTEIKGTRNLAKYMLIIMAVVIVVAVVFIGYDQGWFDGIIGFTDNIGTIGEGFSGIPTPGIPAGVGQGKADYSDASLQARYTPESLKIAIDNGELEYDKLSPFMQGLVDNVEVPQVRTP